MSQRLVSWTHSVWGSLWGPLQLRSPGRSRHHFLEQLMMQASGLWAGRTIYEPK